MHEQKALSSLSPLVDYRNQTDTPWISTLKCCKWNLPQDHYITKNAYLMEEGLAGQKAELVLCNEPEHSP